MIEKEQREVERRPVTKITHKGEIEIENQEPAKAPEALVRLYERVRCLIVKPYVQVLVRRFPSPFSLILSLKLLRCLRKKLQNQRQKAPRNLTIQQACTSPIFLIFTARSAQVTCLNLKNPDRH